MRITANMAALGAACLALRVKIADMDLKRGYSLINTWINIYSYSVLNVVVVLRG